MAFLLAGKIAFICDSDRVDFSEVLKLIVFTSDFEFKLESEFVELSGGLEAFVGTSELDFKSTLDDEQLSELSVEPIGEASSFREKKTTSITALDVEVARTLTILRTMYWIAS